jgi:hypothetical protein
MSSGNNILKSAQNYGSDTNCGFRAVFVPFQGKKHDYFCKFFLYLGFDIQENTLTFRLRHNLGGTSEILKQVWYFTRFALNFTFQNGGTRRKANISHLESRSTLSGVNRL